MSKPFNVLRYIVHKVAFISIAGLAFIVLANVQQAMDNGQQAGPSLAEKFPLTASLLKKLASMPLFGQPPTDNNPTGDLMQAGFDEAQDADIDTLQSELLAWRFHGDASLMTTVIDQKLSPEQQARLTSYFAGYVEGLQTANNIWRAMQPQANPDIVPLRVQLGLHGDTCDPDGCRLVFFLRAPLDV